MSRNIEMDERDRKHWADRFREAPSQTREFWMYRAACYVRNCTMEQAEAIADICLGLPAAYRCIFHATWVFAGTDGQPRRYPCSCSQCDKDRKAARK